jgi:hypothetical protein
MRLPGRTKSPQTDPREVLLLLVYMRTSRGNPVRSYLAAAQHQLDQEMQTQQQAQQQGQQQQGLSEQQQQQQQEAAVLLQQLVLSGQDAAGRSDQLWQLLQAGSYEQLTQDVDVGRLAGSR